MTTRVLIADDQRIVRDGLVLILGLLPGIELVGVAEDGAQALALVAERAPDVVLMDLRMPGLGGVEATRRIRAQHPATQVVVLTTYADDQSVFAALRAGARGYLTKDAGADEIAAAISTVQSGAAMLDPAVQARLLDNLDRPATATPTAGDARGGEPEPALPAGLTTREAQVLTLIAAGLSNAEIARHLVVSEATVKTHINRAFAKAGVRDRAQAVRYAYRTGLAEP